MMTLKFKIKNNLLLSLTLLLSLNITMLNAQSVTHFSISNSCASSLNTAYGNIHISGSYTLISCLSFGAVELTWNGSFYRASNTTISGTNCGKQKSLSCSGGNPPISFPATIVISSPASIVGTYTTDGSGNITSYVMPVDLVSFTAKQENQTIQLDWQTASEEINAGFEVQRSSNGDPDSYREWEVLDFVEGNGTTLEVQNYTYTDEEPFAGNNYYRLKQIDFDGEFEYTHLVSVKYGKSDKAENLRIFPNPVTDRLNIIGTPKGQAMIYNMLGQPVKRFTISNETSPIDVVDLPKGQYILRIQQQNGNMVTKQFVK